MFSLFFTYSWLTFSMVLFGVLKLTSIKREDYQHLPYKLDIVVGTAADFVSQFHDVVLVTRTIVDITCFSSFLIYHNQRVLYILGFLVLYKQVIVATFVAFLVYLLFENLLSSFVMLWLAYFRMWVDEISYFLETVIKMYYDKQSVGERNQSNPSFAYTVTVKFVERVNNTLYFMKDFLQEHAFEKDEYFDTAFRLHKSLQVSTLVYLYMSTMSDMFSQPTPPPAFPLKPEEIITYPFCWANETVVEIVGEYEEVGDGVCPVNVPTLVLLTKQDEVAFFYAFLCTFVLGRDKRN